MSPPAVPAATYRLQFNASFTFADATALAGYLDALGITHCYASSYLKAVPGSPHGYDVCDPRQLNPEIGSEAEYRGWVAALRQHGMGHILDLVPNHMGIARSANPWWQDVLENGPDATNAGVFDIDWKPVKHELENKVLLPILGDRYGAVLERQEILLEYGEGSFHVRYGDYLLPIAPGTYEHVLAPDTDALLAVVGEASDDGTEFLSILTAIRHLPALAPEPGRRGERDREQDVIKRRLGALTARSDAVREHVARTIGQFNGVRGNPATFDRLDALLSMQAYRLAYWRVAAEEINYRRFFDINELAAIRMEEPEVFERVHALVFSLIEEGLLDGLRIDHVDGLFDPGHYLERLQARAQEIRPDRFSATSPLYVVVEKILGPDETLPEWPVSGTTGYDFLERLSGIFVDRRNERAFSDIYERFTRMRVSYPEIVHRSKQFTLRVSMASELNVLAHALDRFSERHRHYRDLTLNSLAHAIREIIACFPVYRTYVNDRDPVSQTDADYIEHAVREAKRRNARLPALVFDFVRGLLLKQADYIPEPEWVEHQRFLGKFQQVTSPVTAKGIEDTALYVYNRLVSLNEVGGGPDRFGTAPEALHRWLETRVQRWPHALSATSTHDSKRGEDVRARLNVLSELPGAWKQATTTWARANRRARSIVDGQSFPGRNEEYLFYQTLVGSWPMHHMTPAEEADYTDRIVAYMLKAMREAKVFSSWLNPSDAHERAMTRFVTLTLAPDNRAFRDEFLPFQHQVTHYGIYNSLAQLAIKMGAPGVPDFYQGSEFWDLNLVDPDNRRPVDYSRRQSLLAELEQELQAGNRLETASRALTALHDDRLKLFSTMMLLRFRRERQPIFSMGGYQTLSAEGYRRDHLFAFTRTHGTGQVLVAVPRLIATLLPDPNVAPLGERVWGETRVILPPDGPRLYHNVLTGQCVTACLAEGQLSLRAAALFEHFPIACLEAR